MFTELKATFNYVCSPTIKDLLDAEGTLNTKDFDEIIDSFPLPAFMSDVDVHESEDVLGLKQRFYFFALVGGKLNVLRWGLDEDLDENKSASITLERDVTLADLVATYNADGLQEPKMFDLFFSAWTAALTEEFSFSTETRQDADGESLPVMLGIDQVYRLSRIAHLGFSADFDTRRLIQHVGVFIPTNIDFYKSSASFEDAAYIEFADLDRENVTYGADEDLVLDHISADVSPAMWAVSIMANR